MKIFKNVLLFFGGLIVLLLIAGLFMKKDYAIEREVVVNRSEKDVFKFVKMVKNQDFFSVWNKKDPNAIKDYRGTDGEVGFISLWSSDNDQVGKGEQEIVNILDNERIDFKLRFKEPFEAEDDAYFETEELSPKQTKVKWGFKGHMNYPMNMMLLMVDMEKELGGDLQKGLDNMKTFLER